MNVGPLALAQRRKVKHEVMRWKSWDLVVYRMMRLFEAGALKFVRCPAPAPHDWSRRCDR
jgi:hypothetical protein